MTPQIVGSRDHLFAPREAYRFRTAVQPETTPYDPTAGLNPPYGAAIDYYLKSAPPGGARIAIVDGSGRTVRTVAGSPQPGPNPLSWDPPVPPTQAKKPKARPAHSPQTADGPA